MFFGHSANYIVGSSLANWKYDHRYFDNVSKGRKVYVYWMLPDELTATRVINDTG